MLSRRQPCGVETSLMMGHLKLYTKKANIAESLVDSDPTAASTFR